MTSGPSDHPRVSKDASALQHLSVPHTTAGVDDAAAALVTLRDELAERYYRGETFAPDDAELLVVPGPAVGDTVLGLCRRVSTLVGTTRLSSTAEAFVASDLQNRDYLAQTGARMVSYFDLELMTPEVLQAFVAAADMPYHCSYVPLQMKILGEREVLLPGPVVEAGHAGLLLLRSPEHLEAARRYVESVSVIAVSAAALLAGPTADPASGPASD